MSGHPLKKYARHVREAIVEAGLPRPSYQWCLAMVQRRYGEAKRATDDITARRAKLVEFVLPIAKLQQDVEGRYRMPPGGVIPPLLVK